MLAGLYFPVGYRAPAELPKQAASFDLPITLGILAGNGQFESDRLEQYAIVGELALDGGTRPTKGALSMAMTVARQNGLRGLIVPRDSAAEAAVVEDVEVIAVAGLAQAVAFLTGQIEIEPTPSNGIISSTSTPYTTWISRTAWARGRDA